LVCTDFLQWKKESLKKKKKINNEKYLAGIAACLCFVVQAGIQ